LLSFGWAGFAGRLPIFANVMPVRCGFSASCGQQPGQSGKIVGSHCQNEPGSHALEAAMDGGPCRRWFWPIRRFGPPRIMNTDQGSQFTSFAWTDRLRRSGVRISMDGKGRRNAASLAVVAPRDDETPVGQGRDRRIVLIGRDRGVDRDLIPTVA